MNKKRISRASKLISTADASRLSGLLPSQISELQKVGLIRPAGPERRSPSRQSALWSPMQVLSFALAKGLRIIGAATSDSLVLMQSISGLSDDDLERHFAAGRTYIGVIGDYAHPTLIDHDELMTAFDCRDIRRKATVLGTLPRCIDAQRVWRNLQRAIGVTPASDGNYSARGIIPNPSESEEFDVVSA